MKTLSTSPLSGNAALFAAVVSAWFLAVSPARSQEAEGSPEKALAAPVWAESDTRLANHYIQLLQNDPAYGNVLDLLWDLYAKKDQTPLLLDYFKGASASGPTVARLLYAHLLRKGGDEEAARAFYDQVIEADPGSIPALKALAEIADRQKRYGKALSLYTRLVELVPVNDDEGIAIRLRKAGLHRLQGQTEAAIADWNELLARFPDNTALRTEIVSLLLEAGETGTAVEVLSALAASDDSVKKLSALRELNRLYEHLGEFEGAARTAGEAMALLHFRNHEYADLFSRRVRIHERFGRLEELENVLTTAVAGANPTEQSLYDLSEFYRIIADPEEEEKTVALLVERVPGALDYRIRLAEIQMRNDHYQAAAATLDEMLKSRSEVPLQLMLMRARIALHGDGREAATRLISEYIARHPPDEDGTREIIEFARSSYLDELVERLLRDAEPAGTRDRDRVAAPIELARFLHERGRKEQALQILHQYVAESGGSPLEKASRLFQITAVLKDLGPEGEALEAIDEAILLAPANLDYRMARVDLYVAVKEIAKAIAQLEEIWASKPGFEERAEIDQRLFSLLRGHYATQVEVEKDPGILKDGNIQTLAQYRRIAAAASQAGRSGDEPPPRELLDYYEVIKKTAEKEKTTPTRYRAAWWGFKLQDYHECIHQLNLANDEAGKPVLQVEQMLLSLAELNERTTMMVRHLTTLAEIDPDNADEYRQKRAEVRFELGFEDEAVRELKELAARPDASLSTLNTLARVYQKQGSPNRRIEVWQRAYRDANIFEKRSIIKQLSAALVESGQAEEALKAQLDLLSRETDPVQRRKQLDTQVILARTHFLLDWMVERYTELARQHPLERFYPEALARVHRAAGNEEEAFEAMKKAYYMSGQNEELLTELGALSDRMGDLKSAIYYRRQLLNRGEGDTLENWKVLISMLEKDLQVEEADRIRKRLENKFGTAPEFLGELTDHYLNNGSPRDAGRTLARLVDLRNWDLEYRFRLALLQSERGEGEEAFATFQSILEETAALKYPDGFGEKILPLIRVDTLPDDEKLSPGSEFNSYIFTVEAYPHIKGKLQDEIAEFLQLPRPEFRYAPKEPHLIRLRSLEEASALAAETGRGAVWVESWNREERPLFERLWATRYAGERLAFSKLLGKWPNSGSHTDQFLGAYSRLLGGDPEAFRRWVAEENPSSDTEHPRSVYGAIAALILLKDSAQDPLADSEVTYTALSGLPVTRTVASHFFSELRKSQRFEAAYRVGSVFTDTVMKDEGAFHYALSQVAGLAGRPLERERLLDLSLGSLNTTAGTRGNNHFFPALKERLGLLESDLERRDYLGKMASLPGTERLGESDRLERDLLISLAAGDSAQVIAKLGPLIDRQLLSIRPGSPDPEQVTYRQSQSWQRMSQVLHYYSDRVPLTAATVPRFVSALGGKLPFLSEDESASAQFEQFEIDRHLLLLEWKNAPEREALVRALQGELREPDSRMELGKALENRGFHREAIPVYRDDAVRRVRDYAPLQGFFDVSAEALEPVPGLAVIQQINSNEFPAPPGLTADYLNEQHARLLLIARDTERLAQLGRLPRGREGASAVTSRSHIPYQDALVELYRQTARNEWLLELLDETRASGTASNEHLLLGATTLEKEGRLVEALDWIAPLTRDSSEASLQRRALLLYVKLQRALEWQHSDGLREIAVASLEEQPSAVTRHLAEALHQSGASSDAAGLLKLLRRRTMNAENRSAASLQLVRIQRESGAEWRDLADSVENLFHDFVYGVEREPVTILPPSALERLRPNAFQLAEWIASDRANEVELAAVIDELPLASENRWLGELLSGFLRNRLDRASGAALADAVETVREQILETLPAFGEEGIAIAREFTEKSARPGTDFFRNEPERQIAFFHRIGDRERLIEVHTRLVQESLTDHFHQSGLEAWVPTLDTRRRLPALFASIGETDLAAALFHAYETALTAYQWNHPSFLNDYAGFLIESGNFEAAEALLKRTLRKSLRIDLRLLPQLYQSWGKLAEWESRTADLHLTRGQEGLLRDWITALAEGREMIEYRNSW